MPFKRAVLLQRSGAARRKPARYTARQAGTNIFSAVCSALASALPPSTGHRMSHSRRDTSLGVGAALCCRSSVPGLAAGKTVSSGRWITASLKAVAASTSAQRLPSGQPCPVRRKAPHTTAAMRTVCSASWLSHVGLHPPPRQKKAAQHRRNSHPWQSQRRGAQRGSGTDIPQPPFGRQACGGKPEPTMASTAQRKPCQHQQTHAACPRADGFIPAELLGQQPGSGHRDARRGQRDEQPVHCQHQLIQAHTHRRPSALASPMRSPMPRQPQHHVRAGEQGRVFQVTLAGIPAPCAPLPPVRSCPAASLCSGLAQNMSGGYGLFLPHFLWYS